jgi:hypothetical protein
VLVGGADYTATISTTYTPVIQTQYLSSVPPGTSISTTMNSYNLSSATGFLGFTWSSLLDGLYPTLLSSVAPGGTAPSGWNYALLNNNQTLTFPTFSGIQAGTPITLTFYTGATNFVGSPTYQITINGTANTSSLTNQWVQQTISFVTTGNDLIVLKSLAGAGGVMSVQAILFAWSLPSAFQIGGIGTDAVNSITIGTGNIYTPHQITITNTPEIIFNAPVVLNTKNITGIDYLNGQTLSGLNVYTNNLLPIDFSYVNVLGDLNFGGTKNVKNCLAITTSSLDAIAGSNLIIGASTSNVYLSNVASLTTTTATITNVQGCLSVNNNSGNTTIGAGNFATYLSNVFSIESGTAGAMVINYVKRINGMSATPCATMWYKNASGVYVSVAIQPKQDGTANAIVFPSYVSFVGVGQTMSITLPGNSYFTITDGAIFGRWDNTTLTPVVRDITAGNFNFSSTTQFYQLLPYV